MRDTCARPNQSMWLAEKAEPGRAGNQRQIRSCKALRLSAESEMMGMEPGASGYLILEISSACIYDTFAMEAFGCLTHSLVPGKRRSLTHLKSALLTGAKLGPPDHTHESQAQQ